MLTPQFRRELEDTLYIHKALPLHRERSLEAEFPHKSVLQSRVLWNGPKHELPVHAGPGTLKTARRGSVDVLRISAPTRCDHWPAGAATDGDYVN